VESDQQNILPLPQPDLRGNDCSGFIEAKQSFTFTKTSVSGELRYLVAEVAGSLPVVASAVSKLLPPKPTRPCMSDGNDQAIAEVVSSRPRLTPSN